MGTQLIWVKAKNPQRVGVWERNPEHPNSEVFVTGDKAYQVARTAFVESKLNNGDLREVAPPKDARVIEAAEDVTSDDDEPTTPRLSAAEARRLKLEAAKSGA